MDSSERFSSLSHNQLPSTSTQTSSASSPPNSTAHIRLEIAQQNPKVVLNLGKMIKAAKEKMQQDLLTAEKKKNLEEQLKSLKKQLIKLQQETPPDWKNLEKNEETCKAKLLKAERQLKAKQKRKEEAEYVKLLMAEERLKLQNNASQNMHFGEMLAPPTLERIYSTVIESGDSSTFLAPGARPPAPKPPAVTLPAAEMLNTDLASPRPVPEEMMAGWWKISRSEELKDIMNACHPRGIREVHLQKQIKMNMECLTQTCFKDTHVDTVYVPDVRDWNVEEHAMKVDIATLQQVEALERKVVSAGLQFKAYKPPKPDSKREDLVYFEHPAACENSTRPKDKSSAGIVRRNNNPLDIAVMRLSDLERNIGKRYKKGQDPEMKQWKKAMSEVCSSAQLSLCMQQLQNSIMCEKSTTKRKRNCISVRDMLETKGSTAKKRKSHA